MLSSWFSIAGCIQWSSFENQNSINGLRLDTQYNTVSSCQQYCIDAVQCVAVDFNLIESTCWVHLDVDDLAPNNTFNLLNITQYQITRNCQNFTGTTTSGNVCLHNVFNAVIFAKLKPGFHSNAIACVACVA